MELISSHRDFGCIVFLTQEHCKLELMLGMSTFFTPPFWKSLLIILHLIFTLLEFHRNSLCIYCIETVISLGIGKSWAKNTNFDEDNVLKIIILPSRVRFLRRHILKTFSITIIVFFKFCCSSIFLLYTHKKKSCYFYCIFHPFSSPILATSYFDNFSFKTENDENK